MNRLTLSAFALLMLLACRPAGAFQLSGFEGPESAVRDSETGAIFVSNVNGDPSARDGNGYISRINASGTAVIQKFIGGKPGGAVLDAPKGMAIWADKLVVTDLDKLRVFDKKTGASLRTIDLEPAGAVFLNDLVFDTTGKLYISDMLADKIFVVRFDAEKPVSVLHTGGTLGGPNGLAINPRSNNLLIVTWRTGSILELDRMGRLHILKRGLKNLDGVDFDDQWNLYVSSFSQGEIYKIPVLGRGTLSVFVSEMNSPADISFDRRKREILVPHMQTGSVESIPLTGPAGGSASGGRVKKPE